MAKRRWLPRKGQVFESRDALEERLLESGWTFEGHGTGFDDDGSIIDYNIGVEDKKGTVWIMVHMRPTVRVTKVKRIKTRGRSS